MLLDMTIRVRCDGPECTEVERAHPKWTHTQSHESTGHFDESDLAIKNELENYGWSVVTGKHYCQDCKANATRRKAVSDVLEGRS